jgi:calcium-dependent protein kinase
LIALQSLHHPNIIKFYDVFEDSRYIHIVTELCTGGELLTRITQRAHYTEACAAELLVMMLRAVAHCHLKNICHRDLKPDNFLFLSNDEHSPIKVHASLL